MDAYAIQRIPFTDVTFSDEFWSRRLETNRTVTIPDVLAKCEQSGRIDNFRKAGGLLAGPYAGKMTFEDTDVYKVIEGASYSLSQVYDAALDARLDEIIAYISAAQEDDGYLYTSRTIDPGHPHETAGPRRWSNLAMSHELYASGHLYEAAVAHCQATGKETLLDVAVKNANLVCATFGPGGMCDIPGHPIIEMALMRLYRVVNDERYVRTAQFFIDQRGRHESRGLYMFEDNPGYCQDHLPVAKQTEATGHAVRAMYLYCGVADLVACSGDGRYRKAIDAIWDSMVHRKIYVTGGIGSRHRGEAFGDDFELPDATAYNETCAAIGSVMWNYRMFLLHGHAKYIDVLEQTLYNGLLAGVSLSGDQFFYVNPLASDGLYAFNHGSATRQPWFDVSCCPTNLCRFFPSLPGYVYAAGKRCVYMNLYVQSTVKLPMAGGEVVLAQSSRYPWYDSVRVSLQIGEPKFFEVRFRIPGWTGMHSMGSTLYPFADEVSSESFRILLESQPLEYEVKDGYACVERLWHPGDALTVRMPLRTRKVIRAIPGMRESRAVALQRGPVVYCFEQTDNDTPALS